VREEWSAEDLVGSWTLVADDESRRTVEQIAQMFKCGTRSARPRLARDRPFRLWFRRATPPGKSALTEAATSTGLPYLPDLEGLPVLGRVLELELELERDRALVQ
jgi:hypothetical protein